MSKQIEALKMAIKALQNISKSLTEKQVWFSSDVYDSINACKEALEQPTQKPVAHIKQGMDGYPKLIFNCTFQYDSIAAKQPDIALYIKEQL